MELIKNYKFHDLLELPWKKTFIFLRSNNLISIAEKFEKMTGDSKQFVCQNFKYVHDLTLVDPFRLALIIDLIKKIEYTEGDIVECGSYKGGSGIIMGLAMKYLGIKKHIHLFDSFQGLPEPDTEKDKGYSKGLFQSNYDTLFEKLKLMGLGNKITIHKGWFNQSIPQFLDQFKGRISLLHIDCDLYSSTKECLPFLYPLVSDGGGVVFDDFNDGGRGEKIAVLECLLGSKETIYVGPAPQVFLFKNNVVANGDFTYTDAGVKYNFDFLFSNNDYLNWLNNKLGVSYKKMVVEFCENSKNHNQS